MSSDPVEFIVGQGWGHYDCTWSDFYGGYATEADARIALEVYGHWLDTGMMKVPVSAELLITAGPFAVICQQYKADGLSGQGDGTGKVDVIKNNAVIGYIPLLADGTLVDITVDVPAQKMYVTFNSIVRTEAQSNVE